MDWNIAVAEVGGRKSRRRRDRGESHNKFAPHVALFVGVAGGAKDVAIGDVVVATNVYGYESGKEDEGGFRVRAEVLRAAHALQQRARAIRQKATWRECLHLKGNRSDCSRRKGNCSLAGYHRVIPAEVLRRPRRVDAR
jgi:hypothetical protein